MGSVLAEFKEQFSERTARVELKDLRKVGIKGLYWRVFTPFVVLWGLIFQRLNADHSLDAALTHFRAGVADGIETKMRGRVVYL